MHALACFSGSYVTLLCFALWLYKCNMQDSRRFNTCFTKVQTMRRTLILFFALVSLGICATGVHAAQTDCQRWWTEYRQALARNPAVHRIRHARHRVHHAAKTKLAKFVHPRPHTAPKVLPARQRLHPTVKQVRHAFDFACGELPDTEDAELLDLAKPADFISELNLPETPLDTLPAASGPIALNELPQYPGSTAHVPPETPATPILGPVIGPIGALPVVPSLPGSPSTPGSPTVPESPVPEPESLALLLTGVLGAAGVIRRRPHQSE